MNYEGRIENDLLYPDLRTATRWRKVSTYSAQRKSEMVTIGAPQPQMDPAARQQQLIAAGPGAMPQPVGPNGVPPEVSAASAD